MKVLIAMSGGVDSAVAALLMVQAGYECTGITMRLREGKCLKTDFKESESFAEAELHREERDAAKICERLGIRHIVADFSGGFEKNVVLPFIAEYEAGNTPNPCVECNKTIKFGKLLDFALENGYDKLVTGHYAQIEQADLLNISKKGKIMTVGDEAAEGYILRKAVDEKKDQSYFLYGLTAHQLSHVIFPLGGMQKGEVRRLAEENGFVNAHKRDSQDICFVPDGDYVRVIEGITEKTYSCGDFIGPEGNRLGEHKGIIRYTIGQRKGLGLALPEPLYVIKKDVETNRVILGKNEALFSRELVAGNVNLLCDTEKLQELRVMAKTRYSHAAQPATAYIEKNDDNTIRLRVLFDEPQRAITPGQSVVLYADCFVVGGGIISRAD